MRQADYTKTIKKIYLTKARRAEPGAEVTEVERGALRAGCGRIAWIARHTRPELAFGLQQLQQAVTRATVRDLMDYNLLVGKAHRDADISMHFVGLEAKGPEDLAVLA